MVFYVNGCKVKIEFSFLIIIAFSLLLKINNVLFVLLFASLHEAGHIISLLLFKCKPDCVTFSFYGIAMKHSAKLGIFEETVFLLSGALVNLLLALFGIFKEINIMLAAVNLLPVIPLDGGRALSLIISTKAMRCVSALTLLILFLYAVLIMNYSLFFISIYILIYSYFEGKN